MKYWLVPILVFVGGTPSYATDIIYSFGNQFVAVTTGMQVGQHNTLTTQQNAPINAYAVQQVAVGTPDVSNDATVKQAGRVNLVSLSQLGMVPTKGHGQNHATNYQNGVINYANFSQANVGVPSLGPGLHPVIP